MYETKTKITCLVREEGSEIPPEPILALSKRGGFGGKKY